MDLKAVQEMPMIQWPKSFETVLSTNDPGLNLTEVLYYVSKWKDLWLGWKPADDQVADILFYSGSRPCQGHRHNHQRKKCKVVFNTWKRLITLRTDDDCKYTRLNQSLSAMSYFFRLWGAFTDYKGFEGG